MTIILLDPTTLSQRCLIILVQTRQATMMCANEPVANLMSNPSVQVNFKVQS